MNSRYHGNLTEEDVALIRHEEETLSTVKKEIMEAFNRKRLNMGKIGDRLKVLREEAAKAKEADLPAIFDQMNTNRAIIEQLPAESFPDFDAPYFARMQLKEKNKVKDVLLGPKTFLDGTLPIIDWRHAPVSRIFFTYRQGDEYEERLPGRIAVGILQKRLIVTIQRGELLQIKTQEASYFRDKEGMWNKLEGPGFGATVLSGGAGSAFRGTARLGTGQTGIPGADVVALLDQEQFAILDESGDDPLLILGGAGCGKTTVALHRIAMLHYRKPGFYTQQSMVVIVPEEGLARLTRKLLDSLQLTEVAVQTLDNWIAKRVHQIIKGLPARICDTTPSAVMHFKRHPAILKGFEKLVELQASKIADEIDSRFQDRREVSGYLRTHAGESLMSRLMKAEELHLDIIAKAKDREQRERVIRKFYEEKRQEMLDIADDRLELFHNMDIINAVIQGSDGDIHPSVGELLYRHTAAQYQKASRQRYRGIDEERLTTVDGRSLLEDDEDDVAGSIDAEDFAVLMDLLRYKTSEDYSRFDKLQKYNHIVLDEAQELAMIELSVIGRALSPQASITISGDAAQQTDLSTTFHSWEKLLTYLNLPPLTPHHLTTNYRSTAPIMEYAFEVLGPLAPRDRPTIVKDGKPVKVSFYPNEGAAVVDIIEELTNLTLSEPTASIAVVAKDIVRAQKYFEMLRDVPSLRFIQNGEFDFKPGVDVTDVTQVKGLEFDYVIIPDASQGIYRDKPEERRLLHVAVTRAIHQLWVISVEEKSSIIP
jgi:DNA helicase-2/ATP-dependent DNA helicase PcrA